MRFNICEIGDGEYALILLEDGSLSWYNVSSKHWWSTNPFFVTKNLIREWMNSSTYNKYEWFLNKPKEFHEGSYK